MRITRHVSSIYIGEEALMHPGGTNLYLAGDRELALIDTGDAGTYARDKVVASLARRKGAALREVFITHGHHDHIGGAGPIKEATGAEVRAHPYLADGSLKEVSALPLQDGQVVKVGEHEFEFIHTPGHSVAHFSIFYRNDKVLFSGDTILGIGTATVRDLAAYMRSLERLLAYDARVICPGHGPAIRNPQEKIREYIAHRRLRENQVLAALAQGPRTSRQLVLEIYADVDPRLHRAA